MNYNKLQILKPITEPYNCDYFYYLSFFSLFGIVLGIILLIIELFKIQKDISILKIYNIIVWMLLLSVTLYQNRLFLGICNKSLRNK